MIRVVINYFKDCIADIAFDGIDIMASQGGYLEIPDYNYPIDPALPFSNKLEVFGNSGLEVPYWFYETSNGIQELQIPTVDEMESSLNIYIENNVFECTNNFTLFEEYSVRGFDNLDVITNIEDDKVYIKAVTELTLDNKGVEQKIENVYAVLDTDLEDCTMRQIIYLMSFITATSQRKKQLICLFFTTSFHFHLLNSAAKEKFGARRK